MKHLIVVLTTLVAVFAAAALPAQTADDAIQLTRSVVQTERQAIVASNLGLSESESAVFWPLYRDYRNAVDQATDAKVDILKRLFSNYETLTDDEAMSLLTDHLAFEKETLKIKTSYAKKMGKVLPGRTVARFFQIENKMDAIIDYEMAGEIPLVK
jgi:hypothetical protein